MDAPSVFSGREDRVRPELVPTTAVAGEYMVNGKMEIKRINCLDADIWIYEGGFGMASKMAPKQDTGPPGQLG